MLPKHKIAAKETDASFTAILFYRNLILKIPSADLIVRSLVPGIAPGHHLTVV